MGGPRGIGIALALLATTSCTQFHEVLYKFDKISGRAAGGAEPDAISYSLEEGVAPRDTLQRLIDWASSTGDLDQAAAVAMRLLFVLEKDNHTLNRRTALRGLETLMASQRMDPLQADVQVTLQNADRFAKVDKAMKRAQSLWPAATGESKTPVERQQLASALSELTALPLANSLYRRQLVTWLAEGRQRTQDPELQLAFSAALRRAIHIAASHGLRESLSADSPAIRATAPELRIAAVQALRRIGGVRGLIYALHWMQRYRVVASGNRYDPAPEVRLALVRLCAQLRHSAVQRELLGVQAATQSGSRLAGPVDFLYETAVEDPEEHLRRAALEGLARSLGRDKVDLDLEWAKAWRQKSIIERGGD